MKNDDCKPIKHKVSSMVQRCVSARIQINPQFHNVHALKKFVISHTISIQVNF